MLGIKFFFFEVIIIFCHIAEPSEGLLHGFKAQIGMPKSSQRNMVIAQLLTLGFKQVLYFFGNGSDAQIIFPQPLKELWEVLGKPAPVSLAAWPAVEERWLKDDTVEIPVQIGGKLRARVTVPADADIPALEAAAAADPRIAELLAGKQIVKVITVPGRMVNFVIR